MPETSLVVKAVDQLTSPVKSMAKAVSSFKKDAEDLRLEIYSLSKNKAYIKLDLKQAKQELREAEERFKKTGSEADGLRVLFKDMGVDALSREIRSINKDLNETEKALSKVENRAGSSSDSKWGANIASAFAASGLSDMAKDLFQNLGTSYTSSAFGSDNGTITSSILSGMATGAAIGQFIPIPAINAAVGAAIGGLAGWANGSMQVFERKDDFFKDYYNNLYEERISAGEAGLTAGSTTAGSREQSYKAFEKRLGEAEAITKRKPQGY